MKVTYLLTPPDPVLNYGKLKFRELEKETEDGLFAYANEHSPVVALYNGELYYVETEYRGDNGTDEYEYVVNETLSRCSWSHADFRRIHDPPEYRFAPYVRNTDTGERVYP